MNPNLIIYPAIAMFALTFGVMLIMAKSRYMAIKRREMSVRFYVTYDDGVEIPRLRVLTRHIQNHFEVPPLFYIGIVLVYVTGSVTVPAVAFAWGFVIARVVHSFVHLGRNNVQHRFFIFGLSLLCLAGVWISLLLSLLAR